MKYLISLLTVLLLMTTSITAQEKIKKNKTIEFEVTGVCGMCDTRIEKAALIKGVKMAQWSSATQTVKVTFNVKKTDERSIHQAIADSGHDTSLIKASEESYSKLPSCCAYRDGIEVH